MDRFIGVIKDMLVSMALGFLLSFLQHCLQTESLSTYLKCNLLTIIITLLAVNSAVLGIILTKIRDIIDKFKDKADFSSTKDSMQFCVYEQVGLVAIYSVLLILYDGVSKNDNTVLMLFLNAALIASFVYAMLILLDVSKSVFILLDFKESLK